MKILIASFACALAACGNKGNSVTPIDTSSDAAADVQPFTVDMIDDFEDGDRDIIPAGGRLGHWWNYPDGTEGTSSIAVVALDPAVDRHTTYTTVSKMALHVQSSGYTSWGSGFSFDVNASSPYDVSAYTGIALWIKSAAPPTGSIRIRIEDVNSDPRGMVCDSSASAPTDKACFDGFGQDLDPSTEWQRFHLPFWALHQLGFGLPVPSGLATRQIYSIAFVNHAGQTYDYYLDDIAFYRE